MNKAKVAVVLPVSDTDISAMSDASLVEAAAKINRLAGRLEALKTELKRRSAETGASTWTYADYSATVYDIKPSKRVDGKAAETLLLKAGIDVPYTFSKGGKGIRFK